MLSSWYLVVRGNDPDLAALGDLCASSSDHSLAQEAGEWRLRSSTVGSTLGHEEAWPALCDLLVHLSDVAASAGYTRVRAVPGALGRTRPDGASDVFVHPEPIRVRVQASPPTVVVNGTILEPMEVKLLRLQASNEHLRLALHFLNADLSWFNLWKAFEPIRDANGGAAGLVARGWTSEPDIDRFRKTANTYAAVGDAARHAILAAAPPPNPIGLEQAEDYVRAILTRWVDSLA
ncbi:MAG: hypothetical protein ABSB34_07780 [Candidatus Limnocylindrales bacterium]|jgi:hypothetical protein